MHSLQFSPESQWQLKNQERQLQVSKGFFWSIRSTTGLSANLEGPSCYLTSAQSDQRRSEEGGSKDLRVRREWNACSWSQRWLADGQLRAPVKPAPRHNETLMKLCRCSTAMCRLRRLGDGACPEVRVSTVTQVNVEKQQSSDPWSYGLKVIPISRPREGLDFTFCGGQGWACCVRFVPRPDLTDELVECWLNYLVMEGEDGQCAVNLWKAPWVVSRNLLNRVTEDEWEGLGVTEKRRERVIRLHQPRGEMCHPNVGRCLHIRRAQTCLRFSSVR